MENVITLGKLLSLWLYIVDSAGDGVLVLQVGSFTQGVNLSLVYIPAISS